MYSCYELKGIDGSCKATHVGVLKLDVVDNKGNFIPLETKAFYVPGLHCRLFSTQSYLKEYQDDNKWVKFNHKKMIFQFGYKQQVTTPYDTMTRLPILKAYKDASKTSENFAFGAWTTD